MREQTTSEKIVEWLEDLPYGQKFRIQEIRDALGIQANKITRSDFVGSHFSDVKKNFNIKRVGRDGYVSVYQKLQQADCSIQHKPGILGVTVHLCR